LIDNKQKELLTNLDTKTKADVDAIEVELLAKPEFQDTAKKARITTKIIPLMRIAVEKLNKAGTGTAEQKELAKLILVNPQSED
jgi:hypothetical protein